MSISDAFCPFITRRKVLNQEGLAGEGIGEVNEEREASRSLECGLGEAATRAGPLSGEDLS
jgi:hypothetical protein